MRLDEDKLMADLERHEGVRLKVYRCPAGKLTLGIGRNIEDIGLSDDEVIFCDATVEELIAGKEIDLCMARYLLRNDITRCKRELDRNVPWWKTMPEPAQRALVNMLFNMGWTRLSGFRKTLTYLQAGLFHSAADEALRSAWADQVGRRAIEVTDLFREAGKVTA